MNLKDKDLENVDDDLNNLVILNDEEGNEVKFEFLDLIEYEEEEYVILLPIEDEEKNQEEDEAGEVVILKLEDTDSEDEESYVSVDNPATLNAVFEIFKEKFKNEFNFIDEE